MCEDIKVSVLCFAEVRDRATSVSYLEELDIFRVACPDGAIYHFYRLEKMYATNFYDGEKNHRVQKALTASTTVRDKERLYHKHEVKRAKEAVRVCRCLGYEGYTGLLHIIRTGAFINLGLTPQDVRRANDIYGPLIAHIKGTSTRCKVPYRNPIKVERTMELVQILHTDLMYVENVAFMVAVSKPMNLITVEMLASKGAKTIEKVIYNFIDTYRSNSYEVEKTVSDNEPCLAAPLTRIPGVPHDPVGAGVHVCIVESKVRRIKEKVRSILHSLPFNWPKRWLHWVIYFAVRSRNRIPVRGSGTILSPVELLTGIKSDARKDLRIAFGDYVQTREMETSNSMKERAEGCLALLPVGNLEGSVKFLDLTTLETINRSAWTPLPITQETIEYVNSLCERENDEPTPRDPTVVYRQGQIMPDDEDLDDRLANRLVEDLYHGEFEENIEEDELSDNEEDEYQADENENAEEDNDNVSVLDDNPEVDDHNDEIPDDNPAEAQTTRSGRIRRPSARLSDESYESHIPKVRSKTNVINVRSDENIMEKSFIFNMTTKEGINKYGTKAKESIIKELKSLLELEVWEPVSTEVKIREIKNHMVPSKLFLKEKFKPDGNFDKLKSRLVAGGHMQDRELYPDKSSPTPAINSIFIVTAIAAHKECTVVSLDIGNAYVNAPITGPPVYMRLNTELSKYVCELDINYESFVRDNGELIVKLKKALYGCVQSSLLWFNYISSMLCEVGFQQNPCDECVFNVGEGDDMITVIVYVDALLIISLDQESIEDLVDYLSEKFEKITVHRGKKHSYIGMSFDFESNSGSVVITMSGYIESLMNDYDIKKTASTPANNNLFKETNPDPLSAEDAKILHTVVAKLLYLATRIRYEILLAVNYLTTRVNKFTVGDKEKANRILEYLNGTRDIGLTLCIGDEGPSSVHLFSDASYGVHEDGKSHSAGVVRVGNAPVNVKSQKQRIVTKSSTESELVCVSDTIGLAYHVKDFMEGQQVPIDVIDLHEDNTSTIAMMVKGGSNNARTRHIRVRYFFIKERIDNHEVRVQHTPTEDMLADILTKPMQGAKFIRLRDMLLNSVMVANAY